MKASNSLEDIKSSWQELSNDKLKKDVSVGDLQHLIRKKSKGELSKIKRKLLIETIISALLLPVYLVYIHRVNHDLAYLTDAFLTVTIVALSVPSIRLLKIGKLRNQETIVFLRKFVYHFNKTIKSSVTVLVVLFPVFFISSAVMGFIKGYHASENTTAAHKILQFGNIDNSTVVIGLGILGLILLCSGVLFLIKIYYMLMYGKHVKNLKHFLAELEENENENK